MRKFNIDFGLRQDRNNAALQKTRSIVRRLKIDNDILEMTTPERDLDNNIITLIDGDHSGIGVINLDFGTSPKEKELEKLIVEKLHDICLNTYNIQIVEENL